MPVTNDQAANFASSVVTGGAGGLGTTVGSGDVTFTITGGDGAKFSSTFPCYGMFGTQTGVHELVKVTARSTDTMTIVRAQEGTSAQTWPVATPFAEVWSAGMLANVYTRIASRAFYVDDYGAVGDGSTNDAAAIQAAITAAGVAGGTVQLGPKTYAIASTLAVGNGSTGGASTINGVRVRGAGVYSTTLKWTGAGSGTMAQINGIIFGCSFGDLTFEGNSSAGIALDLISAQQSEWGDLRIQNTIIACLKLETNSSGAGTLNTIGNKFGHLFLLPAAGTISVQSHGLWLTGSASADSNCNDFPNTTILAQATYQTALRLGFCDFNNFGLCNCFMTAGTGVKSVFLDGSVSSGAPRNNTFVQLNPGIAPSSTGTPGNNMVLHYDTIDGGLAVPSGVGFVGFADNPAGSALPVVPFGIGAPVGVQGALLNSLIGSLGNQNVLSLTSPVDGLYMAYLYLTVVTGSTVVSATAFTGDDTGTQFFGFYAVKGVGASTLLSSATLATGSYECTPIPLRYAAGQGQTPTIQINAGTINRVSVTCSLIKVG